MNQMFLLLIFLSAIFYSCKHELDTPASPIMSYGADVKNIISTNCTHSGCHGTVDYKRFQLLSFNDVITHGGIGTVDATDTKLYKSIIGRGADIMPASPYSPLSDADIKRVLLWIKQGAKNN